MAKRKYHIIEGSKSFFDQTLDSFEGAYEADSFLELVIESDLLHKVGQNFTNKKSMVVCRNDNYHGITEQAHDRLGPLIEEVSTADATVFIHNPPINLRQYIDGLVQRNKAHKEEYLETHTNEFQQGNFNNRIQSVSAKIIGQENAIREIGKSILYLTLSSRKKPYVIMLYGNSSVGKTELVKCISDSFFENKCLETHMSMFQNISYADYVFGDKPNRKTFAYDLYERESNLIFLDEIDKCLQLFYSSFYSLFDAGIYKDRTYEVDTTGLLIIMTSNFKDLKQMKEHLGLPIFYRIEKFIKLEEFSTETIVKLTERELEHQSSLLNGNLDFPTVRQSALSSINTNKENARTIKNKVLDAVENGLYNSL